MNKQNKRKGFTLVELLVVIAIIAILATVSVVGYVGLTKKAKESNAKSELNQAKTLITAYGLTGDEIVASSTTYKFVYNTETANGYTLKAYTVSGGKDSDLTSLDEGVTLKTIFADDLDGLSGTFTVTFASSSNSIETIKYELDGVTATWTISNGNVDV